MLIAAGIPPLRFASNFTPRVEPPAGRLTFYTRFGDAPVTIAGLLMLVAGALLVRAGKLRL